MQFPQKKTAIFSELPGINIWLGRKSLLHCSLAQQSASCKALFCLPPNRGTQTGLCALNYVTDNSDGPLLSVLAGAAAGIPQKSS